MNDDAHEMDPDPLFNVDEHGFEPDSPEPDATDLDRGRGEHLDIDTPGDVGRAWPKDATAIGTIENDDPMPQAWLTRFARRVATYAHRGAPARGQGTVLHRGGLPRHGGDAQGAPARVDQRPPSRPVLLSVAAGVSAEGCMAPPTWLSC